MVLFILLYAVNFIRTLVIIAIIYFGLRIIRRYILPLLIDRGIKNMQQKMQEQQRQQRPQRPEGDVTVETNKQSKHTKDRDNGEYIDFEEVD